MKPQNSWLPLALPALLGGTELLVASLVLAAAAVVSLPLCSLALAPLRKQLTPTASHIAALLIAVTVLTAISLLVQLHSHELSRAVGLSLALLALPCAGLAGAAASAGLRPALLIAGLAILLGALREGLGQASLLLHADWLFGAAARDWSLILDDMRGITLLTLAPGGFILLGILLALARLFFPKTNRT